jgi:2-dehydropantoate 2-reductase
MELTVLGAGAMGTLYAARLALVGHRVAIVARGARRAAIEAEGLRIRPRRSGSAVTARVAVAPSLAAAPPGDLVLVMVRRQDLDGLLPELAAHGGDVVTMVNVASGYEPLRRALGARFFAGFPGATARFEADGTLAYELAPRLLQPTVLGEAGGPPTPRVRALAAALRSGALSVSRSLRAHLLATGEASASEGLALADELLRGARRPLPGLEALCGAARPRSP